MAVQLTAKEIDRMLSISVGLHNKEGHEPGTTFALLAMAKEENERAFRDFVFPELLGNEAAEDILRMINDDGRKTKKQKKKLGKEVGEYMRFPENG